MTNTTKTQLHGVSVLNDKYIFNGQPNSDLVSQANTIDPLLSRTRLSWSNRGCRGALREVHTMGVKPI